MSEHTVEDLKTLLAAADAEICALRDKVGQCATTIMETVMLEDSQGEELTFLRARVSELETIIRQSEEQAKQAEEVFAAMRTSMDRMQETIKSVAGQARDVQAFPELTKKLKELEKEVVEATIESHGFDALFKA